MYTDIDKTGRVSVFELDPVEVKILTESIGHFIDAATSVRSIEYDGSERTGWTVQLMSINQGNIPQPEEYAFMQELFSETNPRLPVVRIDASAAKYLKLSLENARTKVKSGIVFKDKSTERLPVDLLPTRSTNPSDSFKYLTMTKQLRQIAKGRVPASSASSDPQCR